MAWLQTGLKDQQYSIREFCNILNVLNIFSYTLFFFHILSHKLIEITFAGTKESVVCLPNSIFHYENMPIQIYWKFYHQKMKIPR